jgi:hypothetical protein
MYYRNTYYIVHKHHEKAAAYRWMSQGEKN